MTFGAVKKNLSESEIPSGLTTVDAFPTGLSDRFDCPRGMDWFKVEGKKLFVQTAKGKNGFSLSDREFKLTSGSSIALTTSMNAKMRKEVQVAFTIDQIRIGLRPCKNGVEVFVRGEGDDALNDSLSKIATPSESTRLLIKRGLKNVDSIHWFVITDEHAQTGTISGLSLAETPTVGVFVAAPKKDLESPLWLADLKARVVE